MSTVRESTDFTVVNLGVGGDGPLLELATLEEYGRVYSPHIVLWLYCEANDLPDLVLETKHRVLQRYLNQQNFRQNLVRRQPEIDGFWKSYMAGDGGARTRARRGVRGAVDLLTLTDVRALLARARMNRRIATALQYKPVEDAMTDLTVDSRQYLPLFGDVIGRADREAAALGARMYFVYLPTYEHYAYHAKSYHDEVLSEVRKIGIPVIDFADKLNHEWNALTYFPFGRRGHYNANGYRLLAEFIHERLLLDEPAGAGR